MLFEGKNAINNEKLNWDKIKPLLFLMEHTEMYQNCSPQIICRYLLILGLFQTCMSFFLLLSTEDDILKNIINLIDGSYCLS